MTVDSPAPHSRAATEQNRAATGWWRDAVVYQIYPRSFADSDGDGYGDLRGIADRLDSLADLGVDCIWLSPFYVSPGADAGYDVADYRDVDPMFGTLADFDAMLAKAHALGLKVVIDVVPNHCSTEHPWFQAALAAAPGSPERARFHFRDGKGENGDELPSNQPSSFFGPAWTRTTNSDGSPGQWYFHLFDSGQPDWNWGNEEVRAEFRSILRFWLDRGVDGFRIDVANSLLKDPDFPDLPADAATAENFFSTLFDFRGYDASRGNDPIHDVYRDWRKVLAEYDPPRILTGEVWGPARETAPFLRHDEMHQVFNFPFLEANWNRDRVRGVIESSLAANDAVGATTTWVLSNHDVIRHATRFGFPPEHPRTLGIRATDSQPDAELGLRRARALTMAMLALPGSAYLYQGEELGLPEHTQLDDSFRQDPAFKRSNGEQAGRDGCRIPLPWEGDRPAAGFSPNRQSWLPQPDTYALLARDRQRGVEGSTLEMYRAALRVRRERGLGAGKFSWSDAVDEQTLAFCNLGMLSLTNMGATPIDLPRGTVLLASDSIAGETLAPDTTVWIIPEQQA